MVMDLKIDRDICVIGGGPAGAAIAYRLASLGHNVCIVHSGPGSRSRPAATLSDGAVRLLDSIGAGAIVESSGCRGSGKTIIQWSGTSHQSSEHGKVVVQRDRFDTLLLDHAEDSGVLVLRPAYADAPVRTSSGRWTVRIRHNGKAKLVTSKFIVDASGSKKILPGRWVRMSEPLTAIYAYWEMPPGSSAILQAGLEEWFWYSPIDTRVAIAAVFVDPKRLSKSGLRSLPELYSELLKGFELSTGFDGVRRISEVLACDASARHAADPAGRDFIRVGDACVAIDPLSSQGIQSALSSGLQAGIVVNTILRRPNSAGIAAEFYSTAQAEKARQYSVKSAGFYGERAGDVPNDFWISRSRTKASNPSAYAHGEMSPSCQVEVSPEAQITATPVIEGDLVITAPALHHKNLMRPVAYVGDVEITRFLSAIPRGRTVGSLLLNPSDGIGPQRRYEVLSWLWQHGILTRSTGS